MAIPHTSNRVERTVDEARVPSEKKRCRIRSRLLLQVCLGLIAFELLADSECPVKPDGVQRGLVGEIISRFEKRGFVLSVSIDILTFDPSYKIVAIKFMSATKDLLEKHCMKWMHC